MIKCVKIIITSLIIVAILNSLAVFFIFQQLLDVVLLRIRKSKQISHNIVYLRIIY